MNATSFINSSTPSKLYPQIAHTLPYRTSTYEMSDKTVLAFDLYGTLLDTSSIAEILSKHFGPESAKSIATTWRTLQLEYTWRLNSMEHYQPFGLVTKNSLLDALHQHGKELSAHDIEQLLSEYENLHIFEDVGPALDRLRDRGDVECYIFTNSTDKMAHASLQKSPGLSPYQNVFKEAITVEEVRCFKPAPAVYWHLLAKVGKERTQAGEVWLISGNPFDIVGAKTLGLSAVWVDRQGKGWADRLLNQKPDMIVSGLGEVADKVTKRARRPSKVRFSDV